MSGEALPKPHDLRQRGERRAEEPRPPSLSAQAAPIWGRVGAEQLWSVFQ